MDTQLSHRLRSVRPSGTGRTGQCDIDKRASSARKRWARHVGGREPPCAVKAENYILARHNGVLVHMNPLANFGMSRARQWSQAGANRAMDAR
jgi:hypothetical protein